MSINVNDNLQSNSGKSLDNKFLNNGTVSYVSVAQANATITLSYRSPYLTVVVGTQEYWYFGGVADVNLVLKSSGGTFSLPIVRYVYLVQDASDATLMGGASSNTYTTFQAAYDAANTLQVLLGGTNRVVIKVGNTTATAVGNVILIANWNTNVVISGLAVNLSEVGSITATNNSGNGFSVGSAFGVNTFKCYNVRIGAITTNATGVTGNSGIVALSPLMVTIASINTSITNVANTTGNGGRVNINSVGNTQPYNVSIMITSGITTSSQSTTSAAGVVSISASGVSILGTLQTGMNNLGGSIAISPTAGRAFISTIICNTSDASNNVSLNNCTVNSCTVSSVSNITSHSFIACSITSLQVTNTRVGGSLYCFIRNCDILGYTSNVDTHTRCSATTFRTIVSLGRNSYLSSVTFDGFNGSGSPLIDGISDGCRLLNTSFIPASISQLSIDNSTPVTVSSDNSVFENTIGANVTISIDGGVVDLVPDVTDVNWVFDASLYKSAVMYLFAGSLNQLTISKAAIGETYILYVVNTTGTDTLNIVGAIYSGGSYVPTPTVNAADRLLITYDGTNFWVSTAGTNFS